MKKRKLGPFEVAEIGLGCMNLSHGYGVPPSKQAATALLHRALDLGIDHFDTASLYGFGRNEELVGEVLAGVRAKITLASKGGMTGINGKKVIDGRPASVKRDCENSLRRLNTDVIDLYYLHRWDRSVPIEDSVGALSDLIAQGKIRAIGLSEVSAETLERASKVHPIAALQSEYSLWTRNAEFGALAAAERLGTAHVAFSPLGRGSLTDQEIDPSALLEGDIRTTMPRFRTPHFEQNRELLSRYRALAGRWGMSAAALSIAWLLHRGDHVLPIPGTTRTDHLEQDVAGADIVLDQDQVQALDTLINENSVCGERYGEQARAEVDTESALRHG
jgi:aryl-alcohol dehydrogenase-like predicted oxidoreductase